MGRLDGERTALLSDLVERGLDPEQGILFVIDGAKALRKAIRSVFGEAPVHRCIRHKERNVLDHLAERDRPPVKQRLRRAWAEPEHARALEQLRLLAAELEHTHPGDAGSLREGMDDTLTLTRLGIRGQLKCTLESTNPCESMIEIVRRTQRNVTRWSSGEMVLRWTAAGMLEAERQFRWIIGYRDLAKLAIAIEHDLSHRRQSAHTATKEAAPSSRPDHHTGTAVTTATGTSSHAQTCGSPLSSLGRFEMRLSRAPGATPTKGWRPASNTPPLSRQVSGELGVSSL